jgi:hypothetical protein
MIGLEDDNCNDSDDTIAARAITTNTFPPDTILDLDDDDDIDSSVGA